MTATQQFIEDAIKGGWNPCEFSPITEVKTDEGPTGNPEFSATFCWLRNEEGEGCGYHVTQILLDPLAWKAVGKTRGWHKQLSDDWTEKDTVAMKMTDFVMFLADGKDIEQPLQAIQ